ncbi:helix-turn-helix domain-containing protein [Streptomyces sp. NPDC005863]|uniref:helix-turn-helix domain-containing protein n=1 Tax=unclassified Streptomyces TaxID=2593676 RepID=UPI0033FBFA30
MKLVDPDRSGAANYDANTRKARMALRTYITERQRRLGAELRKLREAAGLSVNAASSRIGMGAAHLSHVEAARTAVAADRLAALLLTYDVKSEPYAEALASLAESDGKGWWSEYRRSLPQRTLDLAELESGASRIYSYETLVLPGLLQTEAYMRALFRSSRPTARDAEIAELIAFRRARQRSTLEPSGPHLHVVVHEAAVRVLVGGARVMREQLTHLLHTAALPNVTLQIRPFDAGPGPWLSAPFLQIEPAVARLGTVILEHPAARVVLDDEDSLTRYRATFADLCRNALPPVVPTETHEQRDSWGLLQHLLYTHQGRDHE